MGLNGVDGTLLPLREAGGIICESELEEIENGAIPIRA